MAVSDSSSATLSANAKKRTASRVSLERRRSRTRRHARLRKKVNGTTARPRLVVNRSSRHMLEELGVDLDAIVELVVPDDVVVERLLGRGRSDDTEEVIRNRQKVYRDETAPLLDHYHAKLVSVDAVGSVEEITERFAGALPNR